MFAESKEFAMKASTTGCPFMKIFFGFLAFSTSFSKAQSIEDDFPPFNASLVRPNVYLRMTYQTTVPMLLSCLTLEDIDGYVKVHTDDTKIATVAPNHVNVSCQNEPFKMVNLTVRGVFIGRTRLRVKTYNISNIEQGEHNIPVVIMVPNRMLTGIFIVCVIFFMLLLNFGFGCKLEVDVIKEIIKKPIPPLIGFLCQSALMPLIGLALSKAMRMSNDIGFGILVLAASPGGGGSNVWTLMLGGDLNLSLCMTFFSKIAALFMMPFWLFVLGRMYEYESANIPFRSIATGLVTLIVPVLLGLALRKCKPSAGEFVIKCLKPLALIFVIFVIVFGSITNKYIYQMWGMHWYLVPGSLLCIYFGYTLGYLIARLTRQGHRKALTIAIETGVQDTGIAIVLLQGAFKFPMGDLAASVPMTAALFTPVPLLCILIGMRIRYCCQEGRCVLRPQNAVDSEKVDIEKKSPECAISTIDIDDNYKLEKKEDPQELYTIKL
ncbi:DgyrCDS2836 [Dimorphilus gyrociliatus]|uniref:DgyrCDS2836 n=1 Tax=Dimorphilus gyrociliatus TaxID=2664684 RepID=A0A7I8VBG5_9ANNE|nr:DgyrCDS2836 [Dimorphilus gyrociliatus]